MPRYVTPDALTNLPSLADVPTDQYRQVLDDASTLQTWVADNQWCTDGELRQALEALDWTADRINLALGVLRDTGQVLVLEERNRALVEQPAD